MLDLSSSLLYACWVDISRCVFFCKRHLGVLMRNTAHGPVQHQIGRCVAFVLLLLLDVCPIIIYSPFAILAAKYQSASSSASSFAAHRWIIWRPQPAMCRNFGDKCEHCRWLCRSPSRTGPAGAPSTAKTALTLFHLSQCDRLSSLCDEALNRRWWCRLPSRTGRTGAP